jgi:beta-mannosidase
VGVDGLAAEETIRHVIGTENLMPATKDNWLWVHHGAAWWDHSERLSIMFGDNLELSDRVYASQFIQAEGLRYAIEAMRRRGRESAGIMLWQFNEPFPNATCTSVVDYYNRVKMGYYWVARSFRQVHVSLKYDKLQWRERELYEAACFVHNDTNRSLHGETICEWFTIQGVRIGEATGTINLQPLQSGCAMNLQWWIPPLPCGLFFVRVRFRADEFDVDNMYYFSTEQNHLFHPMSMLSRTTLSAEKIAITDKEITISVKNTGKIAALFVHASFMSANNYFTLLPSEEILLTSQPTVGEVVIRCWNTEDLIVV